jgi:phosphatidylglycerol:prolipoprotein diacylglycerol transferase
LRSTLFYIPHADPVWGIPIFGFGWLLWLIAAAAVMSLAYRLWSAGWTRQVWADMPLLLVFAVVACVAPALEQPSSAGPPLGIPIRAYGVLVLSGIAAGMLLSVRQARRVGVDPDAVVSLCFWIVVAGFVGARVFYVLEYWDQFARPTMSATLMQVIKLTDGGLVVYGSFFGAVAAGVIYAARHHLPLLALADLLAPGLMLGLALGRIGCLLNGCCWGGMCDHGFLGITFPPGSPPYVDQLEHGSLVGMELEWPKSARRCPCCGALMGMELERDATQPLIVRSVVPGGAADQQHLRAGDVVETILFPDAEQFNRMRSGQPVPDALLSLQLSDGRLVRWRFDELPARSHPVYPSQILSSITAALICWFLWSYYPLRRRDGEVFALLVTIYPLARILEEMIRSDEGSVLPTSFRWTISQTVSGILLVLVVLLWCFLFTRPRGTAFPPEKGGRL